MQTFYPFHLFVHAKGAYFLKARAVSCITIMQLLHSGNSPLKIVILEHHASQLVVLCPTFSPWNFSVCHSVSSSEELRLVVMQTVLR